MSLKISNSQWITIVLITAVLMLVFLVFGNKVSRVQPTTLPAEKQEAPENKTEAPKNAMKNVK